MTVLVVADHHSPVELRAPARGETQARVRKQLWTLAHFVEHSEASRAGTAEQLGMPCNVLRICVC